MSKSSVPEDEPNLQENVAADAAVGDAPVQVASAPPESASPEEEESGDVVELGDRILIMGGIGSKVHFTRGRVYYRDGELIRILPDGTSDQIVDIPLVDGEPDPELKIEEIVILEKRKLATFVQQMDFQPEQLVETFTSSREVGPILTVKAVDTFADKGTFTDPDGDVVEYEFGYIGIPRDAPFVVMRTRESRKALSAAIQSAEEAEDVPEAEKPKPLFQILGTLEVPAIPELTDIPSFERIYPDLVQRSDMIQDLLKLKTAAQQKNPKTLVEIRRLVELCILLRNDVVEYSAAGNPAKQKQTSAETLLDLIEAGAPLAKPVLDATKNLYIDQFGDGPVSSAGVKGELLANIVKESIAYMEGEQPVALGIPNQKPAWLIRWQSYVDSYFRSWKPGASTPRKLIKADKDFFRLIVPNLEVQTINGFPKLMIEKTKGKVVPLDATTPVAMYFLGKQNYSTLRGLGPRMGRPTVSRGIEIITSGEEAAILHYILFPFNVIRDVGPTRSGNLLNDSFRSTSAPSTMDMILRKYDGVSDIPTADSIIGVGPEGTTLGNIDVFEYLKRAPVKNIHGYGDFEELFVALGLDKFEINQEQLDVLKTLLDESNAMLKEAIRKLREESKLDLDNPPEVRQRAFANTPEDAERLFKVLLSQPYLNQEISKMRDMTPVYQKIDLANLAFLLKRYPDLVDAVISGRPGQIARERIRAVRDNYQEALRIAYQEERKSELAGLPPLRNNCPHVQTWVKIQKVQDSTDRMRLTAQFVAKFRDKEEGSHLSCINCHQSLMCKHDFLLLQEFLHPQEAQVLHKEILLNYSGGQFQGKYICSACGQPISEIDYDDGLEYDDNGRPMIGRSVLVDRDALDEEEFEAMFGAPTETDEAIDFKLPVDSENYKFADSLLCGGAEGGNLRPSSVAECIHMSAKDMYARLGVNYTKDSMEMIVLRTHAELMKLDSRRKYMKKMADQAKKLGTTKGAVDYDVYINRRLVGLTAAFILIDIQSHIPDYVIRSTLPGCRATFKGFPEGPIEDLGAIEYVSCAVASITRDVVPWNMTGWLRERLDKKRAETIREYLKQLMTKLVEDANVQQLFSAKSKYRREVLGKGEGGEGVHEHLPQGFLPMVEKAKPEEEVVEEAAAGALKTKVWLTKANQYARETANIVESSPFSETSCCFNPVQTPSEFWQSKGLLSPGETVPQGAKGTRLFVDFKPKVPASLTISTPEAAFSRVFLKICFRGPRMGLPHEPGYTNFCPHCEFQFPGDPATIDADKEGAEALRTQDIVTSQDAFQELLDSSHLKYGIPRFRIPMPIGQLEFFRDLRDFKQAPYSTWPADIQACFVEIQKLTSDSSEIDQVNAWTPLVEKLTIHEAALKARLGENTLNTLRSLATLSPVELKSQLVTYFISPIQRMLIGFETDTLKSVYADYELSSTHRDDVELVLKQHYGNLKDYKATFTSPLLRARADELVTKLSSINQILANLRAGLVIVGGNRVIPYLTRAMIMGALMEYVNPNREVGAAASGHEDSVVNVGDSLKLIAECAEWYKKEAKKYSDKEVRELLTARNEKEKLQFVNEIAGMSKELKAIEKLKKKLGLGKWAVGGTKAIYAYDPDRYDYEREERAAAGIVDFPGQGPEGGGLPQGRQVGADGFFDYGAAYDGDGYDHQQQAEDDY